MRLECTNPQTRRLTIKRGHVPAEIKRYVINLLAQEKGYKTIVKMVKDTHQHDISLGAVINIYKRSTGEIEQQKNTFLTASADVPIALERVRLERDEALYQLSQKVSGTRDKIVLGLNCLKEAREESKNAVQPNIVFNQFNNLSDAELLAKKKKLEARILDIKKVEVVGQCK
jgi:hypothetical protein